MLRGRKSGRRVRGGRSGNAPLLVGAAVAGPDVQLGAWRRVESGIIEALAGRRVHQHAVHRQPLLIPAAVAGPLLDEAAIGRAGAGDIHALAVDADGAVAFDGPVLRDRKSTRLNS